MWNAEERCALLYRGGKQNEVRSLQDTVAYDILRKYAKENSEIVIKMLSLNMLSRNKSFVDKFLRKVFRGRRVDKTHLMRMFFKYMDDADLLVNAEEMCANLNDETDLKEWLKAKPLGPGRSTELYFNGAYAGAKTNKEVIEKIGNNWFKYMIIAS